MPKQDKKNELILDLIFDYECYLNDFDINELNEIVKSGYFTLREAREIKKGVYND